jgi:uncharacterized protein
MRIGIISDTHSFLDQAVIEHFSDCDEIWHAGDIGSLDLLEELEAFKPVRAVFGNCDGYDIRRATKEHHIFMAGEKKVLLIHIGGYPGHYDRHALDLIEKENPDIFVCGHSHITRVMNDPKRRMLCINPGSAGHTGIHKVMTILKVSVDGNNISNMEVIEFGNRRKEGGY